MNPVKRKRLEKARRIQKIKSIVPYLGVAILFIILLLISG